MSDQPRSIGLGRHVLDYVIAHSGGPDPVATELAQVTRERFGDAAMMNVEQDQGRFLQFLVGLTGARTVLEVGTFTGMSALFLARGLPAQGRLICLELESRFIDVGRPYWERAGVADRIEVHLGPAASSFAALPTSVQLDLVFIDADKSGYGAYLDLALERLAPGGLIAVDNVLWGGAVAEPIGDDDESLRAIRAFNERVAGDPSLESVMVGVGDGLTLIRRA